MKNLQWDRFISTVVAGAGACANYFFGGLDMALRTLLLLMVLDYITGLICAGKDNKLSSSIGFKGLGKKMLILIIVAVGVSVDNISGTNGIIRSLVIFFYASMEGISILENATRAGVPIPDKLKDMLIQLKEGNKKEIKRED
ncbi:holin family protein [uncultured Clostridium sp.]|uniref:phage holin family protein n=1 Tax=uncultured Clostridium sp. TaxID=59620 RepID=UPI00258972BE|nr:phage holin family protein [uncultured Clostridium sp.]MDU1348254.1 phage holin family protein [Clostridium argentinense]